MSRSGLGDQFEMKLKEILTSTNVQVNVKTDSGGQVFLFDKCGKLFIPSVPKNYLTRDDDKKSK